MSSDKKRTPSKPLLIFDFDGTLADTLAIGIKIYNEIAPEYDLHSISLDEARELRKLHTRALLDRIGLSRLRAVKVGSHIKKILHERMDEVEMIPGTRDAILELHAAGYPMGILSSNSADNIRAFIKRYDLLECFRFIEAGVSLFGKRKRIKNALKNEKVKPANSIYIGDETRDMEASRRAKVAGIAVCWGANGKEAMLTEGPDFCIEHPEELISCVNEFHRTRKK